MIVAVASLDYASKGRPRRPSARRQIDVKTEVLREWIGERIFFDTRLSEPAGVSCASCHEPARAFTGDNGSKLGVARGSKPESLGTRNTANLDVSRYRARVQVCRTRRQTRSGGRFFLGRTRGHARGAGKRAASQSARNEQRRREDDGCQGRRCRLRAIDPARVRRAMCLPTRNARLMRSRFRSRRFRAARLSRRSHRSSTAVVRGQAKFTEQEERGFGLFTIRQKGNCAECHTVDRDSKDPRDSLFTNFGYHALGVAREASIPRNADKSFVDMGLCGPHRTRCARRQKMVRLLQDTHAAQCRSHRALHAQRPLHDAARCGGVLCNARHCIPSAGIRKASSTICRPSCTATSIARPHLITVKRKTPGAQR